MIYIYNSELGNFLKPGREPRTFRNFDVGKSASHRQYDFGNVYYVMLIRNPYD